MVKTLKDFDFSHKKVLLRAGFDVPFNDDGTIADDKRIRASLPTIKYLLDKNACVIIISHNGRPKGKFVEKLSMTKVGERLEELLGRKVKKLDDCIGAEVKRAVDMMRPGDIILLENLRFHKEEEENDENFARELASYADVYVNDAFSNCHRDHASMTGIPKFIPGCVGLLVEKEIRMLSLENPRKPFVAIIGGAKADKISVIRNLLKKVDKLIIGGVLANTFLKAEGFDVQSSKCDRESFDVAKEILSEHKDKIVLPTDCVVADEFDEEAKSRNVGVDSIPEGWMILDIGEKTIEEYKKTLETAKTVVWGGPIGVFEWDKFANGTREIAEFIAKLSATTIIGGGDSAAAIRKYGLEDKVDHVSTGGGASLQLLAGNELPALKALE
ncbi:phosphoglycerate kinase [Candidatus Woesearchaeota archaeon]|nr:MAG: phosphoglycerate kinase [Candidatus Woesearchaeota archaeon]